MSSVSREIVGPGHFGAGWGRADPHAELRRSVTTDAAGANYYKWASRAFVLGNRANNQIRSSVYAESLCRSFAILTAKMQSRQPSEGQHRGLVERIIASLWDIRAVKVERWGTNGICKSIV